MPEDTNRLYERIATLEESVRTLNRRDEEQTRLVESVARLASAVENLAKGQNEIKCDLREYKTNTDKNIDEIKSKPAKRWEAVIAAGISGVVAYLIGRFTKGG